MLATRRRDPTILTETARLLADLLAIDAGRVVPDATILGDLGADLVDLIFVVFRAEQRFGVSIRPSELGGRTLDGQPAGGVREADLAAYFDRPVLVAGGRLAGEPARRLTRPEVERALRGVTVRHLADLLDERLAAQATACARRPPLPPATRPASPN